MNEFKKKKKAFAQKRKHNQQSDKVTYGTEENIHKPYIWWEVNLQDI